MVTEVGKEVQTFYNKTPFPDYDLTKFESKEDLALASWPFAQILDRSIPADASIIDVGTGTGQLSAYLSLRRKNVWGIDFSDGSLAKARALKAKLHLDSWHLEKIDILDPVQINTIKQQFDYVLCLGVLHHTGDPYKGFDHAVKLVKPGGYIAVGLYNKYGRMLLQLRKLLAGTVFKDNDQIKDWFIKMQISNTDDKERARGWWNDQYIHPHESVHTVNEVVTWFAKNNIEYYETLPAMHLSPKADVEIAGVWNNYREKVPSSLMSLLVQLTWIWTTHREGGYWITFGRKRE